MLRIGLTGGIASGKSTVAALFANLGVPIIDTDEVARDITGPGSAVLADIVHAFGHQALRADGTLDRGYLREKVFADTRARQRLEAILHPRIRAEVGRRLAGITAPYCLLVVPLLIETDFAPLVDRILVVDADEASQIERAMARNRLPREIVEKIMAAQATRAQRLACADDTIPNMGRQAELEQHVIRLHRHYLALAQSSGGQPRR